MAREKEEMTTVTVRVPKKSYEEYKSIIRREGKIVTYDLRRYMFDVIENSKKGAKNA